MSSLAWKTPAGMLESDTNWRPGDICWNLDIPATISGGRAIIGWTRLTASNPSRTNNTPGVDFRPMYVDLS